MANLKRPPIVHLQGSFCILISILSVQIDASVVDQRINRAMSIYLVGESSNAAMAGDIESRVQYLPIRTCRLQLQVGTAS